ncbi:hypothetical protein PIIN_07632 [Serendipita indica DSM 11827]|uniref:Uncharacterized protein n=1 Tax=Serendipita indica (strain DSM 11827) TaxID=1109443 RepID=G4TQT6_SERID|nr:hypothetical protein PIIN_07632 [Serendipita indica DSM 11827]
MFSDANISQWNFSCYLVRVCDMLSIKLTLRQEINIKGSRPPLVRFSAVMALIVNWTSPIFIFVLTCETVILRRGYMLHSTDVFGVVFTSLFALPAIRSLLPDAPEFGILISICVIIIAVAKLNRVRNEE